MSFRSTSFITCCLLAASLSACDKQDTVISVNIRTSYDMSTKLNKEPGTENKVTPLANKPIVVHIAQAGQVTIDHTFQYKPPTEVVKEKDASGMETGVTHTEIKLQQQERIYERIIIPESWHDGAITVTADPITLPWDADSRIPVGATSLTLETAVRFDATEKAVTDNSKIGRALSEGTFNLETETARVTYIDLLVPDNLPPPPAPTTSAAPSTSSSDVAAP